MGILASSSLLDNKWYWCCNANVLASSTKALRAFLGPPSPSSSPSAPTSVYIRRYWHHVCDQIFQASVEAPGMTLCHCKLFPVYIGSEILTLPVVWGEPGPRCHGGRPASLHSSHCQRWTCQVVEAYQGCSGSRTALQSKVEVRFQDEWSLVMRLLKQVISWGNWVEARLQFWLCKCEWAPCADKYAFQISKQSLNRKLVISRVCPILVGRAGRQWSLSHHKSGIPIIICNVTLML